MEGSLSRLSSRSHKSELARHAPNLRRFPMNARTLCVAGTMMMAMAMGPEARAQAVIGSGGEVRAARQDTGAVIVRWNQLLQSTLPPPGNPLTPRTYAL